MVLQVSAATTTADPALHGQLETVYEQLRGTVRQVREIVDELLPPAQLRMEVVGDPQPLEACLLGQPGLPDQLPRAELLAGQEVTEARHAAWLPRDPGTTRLGRPGASRWPGTPVRGGCQPKANGASLRACADIDLPTLASHAVVRVLHPVSG